MFKSKEIKIAKLLNYTKGNMKKGKIVPMGGRGNKKIIELLDHEIDKYLNNKEENNENHKHI